MRREATRRRARVAEEAARVRFRLAAIATIVAAAMAVAAARGARSCGGGVVGVLLAAAEELLSGTVRARFRPACTVEAAPPPS